MSYSNFKASIYCTIYSIIGINDIDKFDKQFKGILKKIDVDKVYLETYRGGITAERGKLERLKAYFNDLGIECAGGIATCPETDGKSGYPSLCYSSKETCENLKAVVELTASVFDEIILDDFFYNNCKCTECLNERGDDDWLNYRTGVMTRVSRELIVKPAKAVNPKVKMVIKYPNWYENYAQNGYDLKTEPRIFDGVYTGTETRNPQYSQQHLPKYLSYFLMRYIENAEPGRNGGGWFDPYDCTYNLTSFADQAHLTLYAKAKEVTIYCLEILLEDDYAPCAAVAGQAYENDDRFIDLLGNPVGTAAYLPYHSYGENLIHNYIGMLGIPLEPYPEYPAQAKRVFLSAAAAKDADIIQKIHASLMSGSDVIVTSGFLQAVQDSGFKIFANVRVSGRKIKTGRYAYSLDGGVTFGRSALGEEITFPQVEFPTNDCWALVSALGSENSVPVLLQTCYGRGSLYILAVPDDFGELYRLPPEVLDSVRRTFGGIRMDGPSKIALFTYDNDVFIVRSFLNCTDGADIVVGQAGVNIKNLSTGEVIEGIQSNDSTVFHVQLNPSCSKFFKLIKQA